MIRNTPRAPRSARSSRRRPSCKPAPSSTPTIRCGPKAGRRPWFGSGKEATGVKREAPSGEGGGNGGGLHAEQHFEYHRHIKPGDVLTATYKPGKTWEKEGKRSGKLVFSENITEYHDQNGELVITARGVGVRTERVVDPAGAAKA